MRQLFSVAILSIMASVIIAGEPEKNNRLSVAAGLTGGYLMVKDFVNCRLGKHAPHIFLQNKGFRCWFPELKYYVKDASRYGRYRNVGAGLLAYAACKTYSQQ